MDATRSLLPVLFCGAWPAGCSFVSAAGRFRHAQNCFRVGKFDSTWSLHERGPLDQAGAAAPRGDDAVCARQSRSGGLRVAAADCGEASGGAGGVGGADDGCAGALRFSCLAPGWGAAPSGGGGATRIICRNCSRRSAARETLPLSEWLRFLHSRPLVMRYAPLTAAQFSR